MFFVFQFPIADIRCFVDDSCKLKLDFSRQMLTAGNRSYLRGFGSVGERRIFSAKWKNTFQYSFLDEPYSDDERYYASARNAVRLHGFKSGVTPGFDLSLAFRRMYYGNGPIARFEIGFRAKSNDFISAFAKRRVDMAKAAHQITRHFMRSIVCQDRFGLDQDNSVIKNEISQYMMHIPNSLTNYFFVSTMPFANEESERRKILDARSYVQCGNPIMISAPETRDYYYSMGEDSLDYLPWLYSRVRLNDNNDSIGLFTLTESLSKEYDSERHRMTRRCLSRIHTDFQCIQMVLDLMNRNSIELFRARESTQRFQEYLKSATRRLKMTYKLLSREPSMTYRYISDVVLATNLELLIGEADKLNWKARRNGISAYLSSVRRQLRDSVLFVCESLAKISPKKIVLGTNVENNMAKIKIGGKDSTFNGSIVVADVIRDCFNMINAMPVSELSSQLSTLNRLISSAVSSDNLSENEKVNIVKRTKNFIDESSSRNPDPSLLQTLAGLIIEGAKKITEFIDSIRTCIASILSLVAVIS